MPKGIKTFGNNKARAWESLGFAHKKGCAKVLTQPLLLTFVGWKWQACKPYRPFTRLLSDQKLYPTLTPSNAWS